MYVHFLLHFDLGYSTLLFLTFSHASCTLHNLACIRVPHFAVSQAHLDFWDAAELV
jgi:hypothetical protein